MYKDVKYIYTHMDGQKVHSAFSVILMEYYSAIKKNDIMSFAATWMDLEIIILSEVHQKEEKQIS